MALCCLSVTVYFYVLYIIFNNFSTIHQICMDLNQFIPVSYLSRHYINIFSAMV
jgi:hypothetical protein